MGFFNFGSNSTSTTAASTERKPVILQLNEEQITISAIDAEGKSVAELFSQYADDLGDTDRINRFVAAGQIVNGDTVVELGTVYRGAITSETKGIA
jgi:hypothetical protein